uniref:Uncharacterized protein n=1 Tax=Helianthus annuus TaxID=4232 RepID=A0A251SSW8_HELAN
MNIGEEDGNFNIEFLFVHITLSARTDSSRKKIIGDLQQQEFINTILVPDNFCSSQSGWSYSLKLTVNGLT